MMSADLLVHSIVYAQRVNIRIYLYHYFYDSYTLILLPENYFYWTLSRIFIQIVFARVNITFTKINLQ